MALDVSFIEEAQLKVVYIGIYAGLGLIGDAHLTRLNHLWNSDTRERIRKAFGRENEVTIGIAKAKFKHRFPSYLSDVIHAFKKGINKVKIADAVNKWRWSTRSNSDKFVLRYIHLYGDSAKAAKMLAEGLVFQMTKCNAERELKRGEIYYMNSELDEPYLNQIKKRAHMLIGCDFVGAPVVLSLPQFHDPKAQSKEAANRLVINILENTILSLPDDIEGATFVWDCQHMTPTNWDYNKLGFAVQCVQKCYPLVASRFILYRASKLFKVGFNIVQSWLDPATTSTVHFVNELADLLEVVPPDQLPAHLGGTSTYDPAWTEPTPDDDKPLRDEGRRTALLNERNEYLLAFERQTISWFCGEPNQHSREYLLSRIKDNFWRLDPYVRSRHIWDRHGTLGLCRPELADGGISQPILVIKRPSIGARRKHHYGVPKFLQEQDSTKSSNRVI